MRLASCSTGASPLKVTCASSPGRNAPVQPASCGKMSAMSRSDEEEPTQAPNPSESPTLDSPVVAERRGASPDLTPGACFGPYLLRRLLGRGGMGEVWEAGQIESSRRVALKVLRQVFGEAAERARFLREGRLAAAVNHPNSVYVFGSEEIDGAPAITMELLAGGTLKDVIVRDGALPPARAVDAILQAVAGLEAGAVSRGAAPGHQALELLRGCRRDGQGRGFRAVGVDAGEAGKSPDDDGDVPGDARVRLARAGALRHPRRPVAHLRGGGDAVLPSGRQVAVLRRGSARADARGGPGERSDTATTASQGNSQGPRADRAALPGEAPGQALSGLPRAARRPRAVRERRPRSGDARAAVCGAHDRRDRPGNARNAVLDARCCLVRLSGEVLGDLGPCAARNPGRGARLLRGARRLRRCFCGEIAVPPYGRPTGSAKAGSVGSPPASCGLPPAGFRDLPSSSVLSWASLPSRRWESFLES